jgi:hypothetical protein
MHFPHFFGNAPTTSRQGTLLFYINKNRGNLCQNLKNYILTYQVISDKFTIVRLCTLQRYYNVELAIDFKIQLNILGVLWNGLKRWVTSSYQLWSLCRCRYNSYTVCGLHFTSKDFGHERRWPYPRYNFPPFPVQTYFQ